MELEKCCLGRSRIACYDDDYEIQKANDKFGVLTLSLGALRCERQNVDGEFPNDGHRRCRLHVPFSASISFINIRVRFCLE